jgi:NUMOD4 motif/NUMOD1 domain
LIHVFESDSKFNLLTKKYQYQHLELNDLPTEKWKWIPWLVGYYRISNFGRVRRESFEITMSNGYRRMVQEKIMAPELQKVPNHYVGDLVYSLRARVLREGIDYSIAIARVTFYCFKRKFDLENKDLMVLTLDGDGRNIRPDNLTLVNTSQKQQRIFDRKRSKKPIIYSYDEFKKGLKTSANSNCRQVTQYSMEGEQLKTYLSIKAAAVALKLSESGINSALKDRQISSGGFVWRYGTDAKVNLKPILEKRSTQFKLLRGIKISQYDTRGKRIKTYLTISDAAKKTGIHNGDISLVINGRQKSAGGFIWKKGWGENKINVKQDEFGEVLRAKAKWKKVRQYDSSGKYIRTHVSIKAAAASINLTPSSISTAIKSKTKLAGGFKWKF